MQWLRNWSDWWAELTVRARAKNLWSLYAPGIHIGLFEHSYLSNIPSQLIVPERGTIFVKIDCQPSSLQMFLSTIPGPVTFTSEPDARRDELHSNLLYHARKLTFRSDNCGASCFDLEVDIIQASVKNFVEKFRLNRKGANTFENPLRELLLREFFASGNLRRRMTLIFKCKSREFLSFFPFFLFLTLCENVFAP